MIHEQNVLSWSRKVAWRLNLTYPGKIGLKCAVIVEFFPIIWRASDHTSFHLIYTQVLSNHVTRLSKPLNSENWTFIRLLIIVMFVKSLSQLALRFHGTLKIPPKMSSLRKSLTVNCVNFDTVMTFFCTISTTQLLRMFIYFLILSEFYSQQKCGYLTKLCHEESKYTRIC